MFSLLLAIAQALSGQSGVEAVLVSGAREIGGALMLGLLLGIPMAYITDRIRPGEPTQAEAIGLFGFVRDWQNGLAFPISCRP